PVVRHRRALLPRRPPGPARGTGVLRRGPLDVLRDRAHRRPRAGPVEPQRRIQADAYAPHRLRRPLRYDEAADRRQLTSWEFVTTPGTSSSEVHSGRIFHPNPAGAITVRLGSPRRSPSQAPHHAKLEFERMAWSHSLSSRNWAMGS